MSREPEPEERKHSMDMRDNNVQIEDFSHIADQMNRSLNISAANDKIFEIKQRQGPQAARDTSTPQNNRKLIFDYESKGEASGGDRPAIVLDINLGELQ